MLGEILEKFAKVGAGDLLRAAKKPVVASMEKLTPSVQAVARASEKEAAGLAEQEFGRRMWADEINPVRIKAIPITARMATDEQLMARGAFATRLRMGEDVTAEEVNSFATEVGQKRLDSILASRRINLLRRQRTAGVPVGAEAEEADPVLAMWRRGRGGRQDVLDEGRGEYVQDNWGGESFEVAQNRVARQKGFVKDLALPARIESVVSEKFPGGKHSPEATQNWITKQGFKQDEIKWSGITELIDRSVANQKSLTKKDIAEHLEQARIPLEVRTFRQAPEGSLTGEERALVHDYTTTNYRLGSDLPGPAKDYQELTVVAPQHKPEFDGGHFREKQANTVGYVRFDIRKTEDGKNVAFAHNVQSDWNIATSRYGEKGTPGAAKAFFGITDVGWNKMSEDIRKSYLDEMRQMGRDRGVQEAGTTPFPFKKNWTKVMMKAFVKDAIDKDLDGVVLTSGKNIKNRWGIKDEWNPNLLYDKQLVNDLNEMGTKYGAKVEKKKIDSENKWKDYNYFPITPALKEAFKKGKIFMWGLAGAAAIPAVTNKKEES